MSYKAIRGMSDVVAPEVVSWQYVESVARQFFAGRSYDEVRTPIVEYTDLFVRSIGEETDIVHKEMYTFQDRKGRSLSMRPEMTASVVRAVIENRLLIPDEIARFFYIGPMFRAERPQAGRRRQFHQIGAELFGAQHPYQDVEMIVLIHDLLCACGLSSDSFTIKVNSIGNTTSRQPYYDALRTYLEANEEQLCDDCRRRMQTTILRVLDCKVATCRHVCAEAPSILDHLSEDERRYFDTVCAVLTQRGIAHVVDHLMVRGLDYYSGPVFEVVSTQLGAQDAIAAGGRYDGLVKSCGGPNVGGIGFALGVERLLLLLQSDDSFASQLPMLPVVYVAHGKSDDALRTAFDVYHDLAASVIPCRVFIDMTKGSLKSQLRQANKKNASLVIIAGDDEVAQGQVSLKNMNTSTQESVAISAVVDVVERSMHVTDA